MGKCPIGHRIGLQLGYMLNASDEID